MADGAPFATHSSALLPVLYKNAPAMLKVATHPEERSGVSLMLWWNGEGAARVLAHHADAVLLERAVGPRSLSVLARTGHDDEASRNICSVAAKLHAPRPFPPPLVPLATWFRELQPAAVRFGGILQKSLATSCELIENPAEVIVLHGDLHHANVLDAGPRGWLAVDPKGLLGERAFDFANIFCNPDFVVATAPGRLRKQAFVVADAASLDRRRLLQWILAYAGLSAAWSLTTPDEDPRVALAVAGIAAAELDR